MDRLAVTRAKMADSQKRKKESALASTKRRFVFSRCDAV